MITFEFAFSSKIRFTLCVPPMTEKESEPTTILVVCAWCKKHLRTEQWDELSDPSKTVDHDICPDCFRGILGDRAQKILDLVK